MVNAMNSDHLLDDKSAESACLQSLTCRLPEGARIKVIGLGGVGSILLEYLAIFLRSLQQPLRLVLIDGDNFESRNAERMKFTSLGKKADVKTQEATDLLAGSQVGVVAVPEYVGIDNIQRLIRDGDAVFLCVDNHQTRRLVAEHCQTLSNVALFSGGNDGVEPPHRRGTYGNAQMHFRVEGRDVTMPITKLHPEIRNASGDLPGGPNCGQMSESSPQILMANLAVASHLLNMFFAWSCGALTYQELQFDILEGRAVACFPLQAPVGLPAPSANPSAETGVG
ncbi:MAG: ThiF family adenylyltransferase [Planctomycetaceae bacterium]|nr:ThiF family adenylyltransferase [Planctomycetaceae bacterium]